MLLPHNLVRVVYGLGVAGIGLANAKMLCRHFHYDFDAMRHASVEELTAVDGIGDVLADAWCQYFADEKNNAMTDHLLAELTLEEVKEEERGSFPGWNGLCDHWFCGTFRKPEGVTDPDRVQGRESHWFRDFQNHLPDQ